MYVYEFEELLKYAKQQIGDDESAEAVIVVETNKTNIYSDKIYSNKKFHSVMLNDMISNSDVIVKKIIYMTKNGNLENPAFEFETALLQLDDSNKNSEVLLFSARGPYTRKLKNGI